MRVLITQGVMMNQEPLSPGDIRDLADHEALYLIGGNRAVKHHEPAAPKVEEVEAVAEPAPEVEAQSGTETVQAEKVTAKKSKKTEK